MVRIECAKRNYIVSQPSIPARYDMIIDDGKTISKVQVKTLFSKKYEKRAWLYSLRMSYGREYLDGEIDYILVCLPLENLILKIDNIGKKAYKFFVGTLKKHIW